MYFDDDAEDEKSRQRHKRQDPVSYYSVEGREFIADVLERLKLLEDVVLAKIQKKSRKRTAKARKNKC